MMSTRLRLSLPIFFESSGPIPVSWYPVEVPLQGSFTFTGYSPVTCPRYLVWMPTILPMKCQPLSGPLPLSEIPTKPFTSILPRA